MSNIPHKLSSAIVPRSLYALEQSILGWAHERNLIKGSTCRKQLAKTCEEFGELAAGLNKGKHALIMDGVGDVLVTLIIANGCAGGEYLFLSEEAGNDWAIVHLQEMLDSEGSEVVLSLLYELDYITERSRLELYKWRTTVLRDMIRWLVVAAKRAECSLAECLLTAWMEIKDRKGRMVDGVFVKEADLPSQPLTLPELDELVRSPEQEAPVPPDHNC